MILEIAIESVDDALAAERGGADRLELCGDLHLDGLTPAWDTLVAVKRATSLPVMVMIRPRAGDFCYSAVEIAIMEEQIADASLYGADGLVFGVLNEAGQVNLAGCRTLLKRCAGRPAVFHRAFDDTPDPVAALEQLIALGFSRILTSGREADASSPDAAALIARLITQSAGRIEIMPGGGVRPHNAAAIIRATGCTQLHSSCRPPGTRAVDARIVPDLRHSMNLAISPERAR